MKTHLLILLLLPATLLGHGSEHDHEPHEALNHISEIPVIPTAIPAPPEGADLDELIEWAHDNYISPTAQAPYYHSHAGIPPHHHPATVETLEALQSSVISQAAAISKLMSRIDKLEKKIEELESRLDPETKETP